jgi:hypothetical protein
MPCQWGFPIYTVCRMSTGFESVQQLLVTIPCDFLILHSCNQTWLAGKSPIWFDEFPIKTSIYRVFPYFSIFFPIKTSINRGFHSYPWFTTKGPTEPKEFSKPGPPRGRPKSTSTTGPAASKHCGRSWEELRWSRFIAMGRFHWIQWDLKN